MALSNITQSALMSNMEWDLQVISKKDNEVVRNILKLVAVIEHNIDVIKLADYIIDIGPDGELCGGEIVFAGTPKELVNSNTITAEFLRKDLMK